MSIFGQKWFHIAGNTFSDFSAKNVQNLPSQSWKNDFFHLKSVFFATKFQPNQKITAKPMVLSYVEHLYNHFKKIKKSLDRFFLKVIFLFFNRFTPISPCQDFFIKKAALWRLSPYGYLTSYQISEKLLELFLR